MKFKLPLLLASLVGLVFSQTTNFVDKDSKVNLYAEPQWLKDNIPFVEIPDQNIEDVYYYRWSTHKRHLRYTHPGAGYIVTEFVHDVSYSRKFGTLNDAAGHHIYESRWLRDPQYAEDYINFWTREGGGGNQQYSEWIADAAWKTFLVTGNKDFIQSQQQGFVANFNDWSHKFSPSLNLFFISPHNDAMEFSASSLQTDDPFTGGLGYRPSFNSEMYANAIAISKIAKLNNDTSTAEEFEGRAEAIRAAILRYLWDDERTFFYHMFSENNPNNELLDSRENVGFFPWRFGVPTQDPKYSEAWLHLLDSSGFDSVYGPTTCEQRSKWFDGNQTSQCCWWNGNSWPYSTGFILNSLSAQIKNYGTTSVAHVDTFMEIFKKYALVQYNNNNDKPYVGECHSPYRKLWVCDAANHSEHYAHSTYIDNVIGDMLGIEPQDDDSIVFNPLVPSSWPYFIVENLFYHGNNITFLYDATGEKYNVTPGMHVYVNGVETKSSPRLEQIKVNVETIKIDESYRRRKVENYAANVNGVGYPSPSASFTGVYTSVLQAVDGRVFYDFVPSNRWTNWDSPNKQDWFTIDFGPGRSKTIDEVKIYIYSDVVTNEGHVDCPKNITVQIPTSTGDWEDVRNQVPTPSVCVPNDVLTIRFDPVKTQKVRLLFTRNEEEQAYVGITEVEIWAPWPQVSEEGVYEAEDGVITGANMHASETASGGSYVGQIDGSNSAVEFTGVWVEEQKEYTISVYYSNAVGTDSTMELIVNSVHRQTDIFPPTLDGWGNFNDNVYVNVTVPLLRGNNVIVFKHGDNFVELDKIKVIL